LKPIARKFKGIGFPTVAMPTVVSHALEDLNPRLSIHVSFL
jgi:hypothetical protein